MMSASQFPRSSASALGCFSTQHSDRELLKQFIATRSEAAFATLVMRHGPMVLGVCRNLLRNPHDAEDAFQATFLVLVRKATSVHVGASLGNWLYGVAYRVAARARFEISHRHVQESRGARMDATRGEEGPSRELVAVLHDEVNRLPAAYREVVVHCYLEGLTHDEAAQQLGWPLGTVKGRLARARDLLRSRLTRRGVEFSSVLLLGFLGEGSPAAALPQELVALTVGTALEVGPGSTALAGSVSASVASMVAGGAKGLTFGMAKLAIVGALASAIVSAAVAWWAEQPAVVLPSQAMRLVALEAAAEGSDVPEGPVLAGRSRGPAPERTADAAEQLGKSSESPSLYHLIRRAARRDADAHVRLALWCERHGMESERLRHLAQAILINPAHAGARGLLGLIAFDGRWQRAEDVAAQVQSDAARAADLARYQARRDRTPQTASAQWKLGLWCEQRGLEPEATAHFTAVTRLDPNHEAARRRLGCRSFGGRWLSEEQIKAYKAEVESQRRGNRVWKPRLELWRLWLANPEHRETAQRELATVNDPYAVPSVWNAFAVGGAGHQIVAVQVLGQIQSPLSTRCLALLAVSGKSSEVRRVATETLLQRDPREFVEALIDLMRVPIKYEVRHVGGPGSPGYVYVEGQRFDVRRLYAPPSLPVLPMGLDGTWDTDRFGWPALWLNIGLLVSASWSGAPMAIPGVVPVDPSAAFWLNLFAAPTPSPRLIESVLGPNSGLQMLSLIRQMGRWRTPGRITPDFERQIRLPIGRMVAEIHQSARMAEQQLKLDLDQIKAFNHYVEKINEPIVRVLSHFNDQLAPGTREDWLRWWRDEQGYGYDPPTRLPRPTLDVVVPLAYTPRPVDGFLFDPIIGYFPTGAGGGSCFGAGTLVTTLTGLVPIEAIHVGDQVLARDSTTGELSFQPVLAVFHNKPKPLLAIDVGEETIRSTGIHRFWSAGKGWTMARDLAPGDRIRTVEGVVEVESIKPEPVEPVFNLEVANRSTFFVGRQGLLVHDNSQVSPTVQAFDQGMVDERVSD